MNNIYSWQQETWRILTQDGASLGHALLLRGRQGIGKLAFARQLAKFWLCQTPSIAGHPCGTCPSCTWFEQDSHPDFRQVEPEAVALLTEKRGGDADEGGSEEAGFYADAGEEPTGPKSRKKPSRQITIAQVREIADFLGVSSHQGGYKIIVLHPAESMNPAAANALLKNLEEPPPLTLFILVTHQAQDLLPTLRSRCRQIPMPIPDPATAAAWLAQQGVGNPAACLASSGYAPLAALEFDDGDYQARHKAFIDRISVPATLDPVTLAEDLQKSDLPTLIRWLQKWCYDLMSFCTTGKVRYHASRLPTIESLAPGIDPRALSAYLRTLNASQRLAQHPLNPRLFLEDVLFSYAESVVRPPADSNVRGNGRMIHAD
ncbi:DNA polymerase III subunit delta' [Nitrosovibrio sp. Nv17]|uniref:DNA polymerase III subunit delta' n=1 Tax=Nitrosovibrio sp. Nv17 TaxID=1855339 RepID=UPI000908DC16|nr:DNA polymerase III subunit delta' [Nitrosovibrio sp. Nv17]SFW14294.1 DNA polymerase III, delta prime subunit [Nitrosovibrio sp. Nv17]